MFATEVVDNLFRNEKEMEKRDDKNGILKKHFGGLLTLIAEDLNIKEEDIVDLDLNFADI